MDTDTPAEGKAEIMVLCGHLIGPEQHGCPQRSSSVSHFLDYRVKGHSAVRQITLDVFNGSKGKTHKTPKYIALKLSSSQIAQVYIYAAG